jgi:hypothetical protein
MNASPIDLQVARNQLERINDVLDKPHLLIGGLAVQRYVPLRDSKDIDLVCESAVARKLLRDLFPTSQWKVENTTDDEYRPSFVVRHQWENLGDICFGPKVLERKAYEFISWEDLLKDGVPFEQRGKPLANIVIPKCSHLAFTKLISFLSRDRAKREKRRQDLQDFVDLSNNTTLFCPQEFLSFVYKAGAWDYLATNFRVNDEEDAILAQSCLRKMSVLFGIGARLPVVVMPNASGHLVDHTCGPAKDPGPQETRAGVEFGHSPDKFTDAQIVALIQAALEERGIAGPYKILILKTGSVIVTIDLPSGEAEQLCELINSEGLLRLGALKAYQIQLGREAEVLCDNTWGWLRDQIVNKYDVPSSLVTPQAAFGQLRLTATQIDDMLSEISTGYKIPDIAKRFAAFIVKKHGLSNLEDLMAVPVGDLCDFVHENHRLKRK